MKDGNSIPRSQIPAGEEQMDEQTGSFFGGTASAIAPFRSSGIMRRNRPRSRPRNSRPASCPRDAALDPKDVSEVFRVLGTLLIQ